MVRSISVRAFLLFMTLFAMSIAPQIALADWDLTGAEILRFSRIAHGGKEYEGLQNFSTKSEGFVNVAPLGVAGFGGGSTMGAVELKLKLVDYQDKNGRRRLDVQPTSPAMQVAPTYLVYTGTQGGGMYQGNEFRVSETAASRQWAMMGFAALNMAANGQLTIDRDKDVTENGIKYYIVDVKFSPEDTVRYWIDQKDLLIAKAVTRYKTKVMIEETRSDYRKVSCMQLPFRIVTKLQGQKLADLTLDSYDLKTVVNEAKFTLTATP